MALLESITTKMKGMLQVMEQHAKEYLYNPHKIQHSKQHQTIIKTIIFFNLNRQIKSCSEFNYKKINCNVTLYRKDGIGKIKIPKLYKNKFKKIVIYFSNNLLSFVWRIQVYYSKLYRRSQI